MQQKLCPVRPCLQVPSDVLAQLRCGRPDARAVARAVAHIHANPFDTLSLAELADAAHLSRFHFSRVFRSFTGRSPMQYVRHLRIEYAKQMLCREANAATVAADLGFFDQSHFSRTFRRITGTTPGHFAGRSGAAR